MRTRPRSGRFSRMPPMRVRRRSFASVTYSDTVPIRSRRLSSSTAGRMCALRATTTMPCRDGSPWRTSPPLPPPPWRGTARRSRLPRSTGCATCRMSAISPVRRGASPVRTASSRIPRGSTTCWSRLTRGPPGARAPNRSSSSATATSPASSCWERAASRMRWSRWTLCWSRASATSSTWEAWGIPAVACAAASTAFTMTERARSPSARCPLTWRATARR